MPAWTPEIVVDEAMARRLITDQFPELAGRPLRLLAEGWDNTIWAVDETFAFRFPRREVVAPAIEAESRVLPLIAPLLPTPISTPIFRGVPTPGYPWPFLGSRLLPGRELAVAGLDDDGRDALARPLGVFLRRLHSSDVASAALAGGPLPIDPMGRADMARRVPVTRDTLADVERLGLWQVPPVVDCVLDEAHSLVRDHVVALVHGDLHFRQLLVHDGALSGVIDWVDVCLASRAVDLISYWCLFGPAGRAEFRAAYGPLGDEELTRARVLAFNLCGVLATYGRDHGGPAVEREAVGGLCRAAIG